jgi:carbamate kinase
VLLHGLLEHELVITHGTGPQVGLLALQAEAYKPVPAYPLDVLGAESEGMIGYLLEQGLIKSAPRAKDGDSPHASDRGPR